MAQPQWKIDKGLLVAVMNSDGEGAAKYLRKGADPNQSVQARNGASPLLSQALFLTPHLLGLFIERGAKVNVTDETGITPLHMAMESEHIEQLLAAGGSPLAKTSSGETPLHCVLTLEGARMLVDAGGDPRTVCNAGRLPWQGVQLMAGQMQGTGPKAASRRQEVEAAANWLRAKADGEQLDELTPTVAMTDEASNAKAQGGRL